jgi:hypothetical protein
MFAFLWFSYMTTGDAFAPMTSQYEGWGRTLDWPWFNLYVHLARGGPLGRYWIGASLLFSRLATACEIPLLRRILVLPVFLHLLLGRRDGPHVVASAGDDPVSDLSRVGTLPRRASHRSEVTLAVLATWNAVLMVAWTLSDVIVT